MDTRENTLAGVRVGHNARNSVRVGQNLAEHRSTRQSGMTNKARQCHLRPQPRGLPKVGRGHHNGTLPPDTQRQRFDSKRTVGVLTIRSVYT